jgi:hypothetical protein
MNGTLFVGSCVYEPRPYTRVEPLAIIEDGAWRVYDDWRDLLPTEGRVFSPRSPGFGVGQRFAFNVEKNERWDATQPDRYLLSRTTKLEEILDYRRVRSEQARRMLVEQGIDQLAPGTSSVVAALEDGSCVVLDMILHPVSGRFVANVAGLHSLATHGFDATVMESDQIEGRVYAIPGVTVKEQVGRLDWSPDFDFLDTLLKRLRRIAASPKPFPFRRAQTESLITYLSRAALLPAGGEDLARMKERLTTFVGDLKLNTQELDELIDVICNIEAVGDRLAEEVASRRAELEGELRSELSISVEREVRSTLQAVDDERSKLAAEAADLSRTISDYSKAIANLKMAQSELAAQLSDELISLQGNLDELPSELHDQVVELSRRVAERLNGSVEGIELTPARAPPWARIVSSKVSLQTWEKGAPGLRDAAKRWGFQFEDLVCADIAARAGRIVLIPMKLAADFCSCYAASISAGYFVRHALDPSILSLDDLWRQPPAFAPTGLARAWAFAVTHPRRYIPVLLDGLGHTSLDLWLPSLVDELRSIRRPANLLFFATLGEKIIDRARIPEHFGDLVVPVLPQTNAEISTAILAKAGGPAPPNFALDCATVSQPTRVQILEILEQLALPQSGDPTEILRWISAAWALRDVIDPSTATRAFVDSMSVRVAIPKQLGALRKGRDWLSELLLAG